MIAILQKKKSMKQAITKPSSRERKKWIEKKETKYKKKIKAISKKKLNQIFLRIKRKQKTIQDTRTNQDEGNKKNKESENLRKKDENSKLKQKKINT